MESSFGQITMSGLLTILLALAYTFIPVDFSARWKVAIAVTIGMGLGVLAIPYNSLAWEVKIIVDHLIEGLIVGATAVGLHQIQKVVRKST